MKSRLQKLLAQAGAASRRKAEELILQGRVTVNGRPAKLGDSADPQKDQIALDGQRLRLEGEKLYLALHKPRGFVCKICGFIYESDTLPDDYVCPICRRPAADFEPVQ